MKRIAIILTIITALICGGGSMASAEYIQLANREIFIGSLVKITESTVVFKTSDEITMELRFDEVTPKSLFDLRESVLDTTSERAQLDLAQFAMDNKLLSQARRMIESVVSMRGDLQETAYEQLDKLRVMEARHQLSRAARKLEKADFDEARELCHIVMRDYSDTPSASIARDFIDEILEEQRLSGEKASQEEREEELAEAQKEEVKERKRLDRLLKEVTDRLDQAKEDRAEGLEAEADEQVSRAVYAYRRAEKAYYECRYILDKYFLKVKFQRMDYVEKANKLQRKVQKNLLRCLTEYTTAYISVPNWKAAYKTILRALAIDSEDDIALDLLALIKENYIHFSVKNLGGGGGSGD